MIAGGNITVYVANMDNAVRFYTEVLGLKLYQRFGDHWAEIEAGRGLTIGLHPATEDSPAGQRGSISIGFAIDGSMEEAVQTLKSRGVRFAGPIVRDKAGEFAMFSDADGHPCYLYQMRPEYVTPRA